MPSLRRARPDDLDAMWDLEQAAFEPERRSTHASLRRSLLSRRQHVEIAEKGGIVGFAVAWTYPRTWRVMDIAVADAVRGQGVGSRLLTRIEGLAAAAGASRILLEADVRLPELVAWYRDRGYVEIGVAKDHYGPGRDAVRMVKDVAAAASP